jgi:H+/Cl- antiporter ClcA
VASGRGATEQPNAAGDEVPLTARFWTAVVASGAVTGMLGALMMYVLFSVQDLSFGHRGTSFQYAVVHTALWRRVVVVVAAGVVAAVAWSLLRRLTRGERSDIDDAVWNGTGGLSFRRSLGTSLISEVVVGMGASLGRENAPKLMGGAAASVLSGWFRLAPAQRRLLVACSAGAGLACVYNVPLGGALFTAELLVGVVSLPVMLPALLCAAIATATAWVYLPQHATYVDVPAYHFELSLLVFSTSPGPSWDWCRWAGCASSASPAITGRAGLRRSPRRSVPSPCWAPWRSPTRSCSATARTWPTTPSSGSGASGSSPCCSP